MKKSFACLLAALVPLALMASACGGSPAQPTTITDTFSGSFGQGGSDTHSFTVQQAGNVDVTLTVEGPVTTLTIGLGVGNWNGSTCSIVGGTNAVQGTVFSGTATPGTLCVQVWDVGNVVSPTVVTYTITVAHT